MAKDAVTPAVEVVGQVSPSRKPAESANVADSHQRRKRLNTYELHSSHQRVRQPATQHETATLAGSKPLSRHHLRGAGRVIRFRCVIRFHGSPGGRKRMLSP